MLRCLILSLAITSGAAQAQTPGFTWALGAGGPSNDRASGIAATSKGAYVAGTVAYETTFGDTTVSAGFTDPFLAMFEPDGTLRWLTLVGGPDNDQGKAMAIDTNGFAVATGYFQSSAQFGVTTLQSTGQDDIFLVRFSKDGAVQWALRAGGPDDDGGLGVGISESGDRIAVTGYFRGSADFNGTTLSTSEDADIFVALYDSTGTMLWVRQAGAADAYDDVGTDVAITSDGGVVVTGYFDDTADFSGTTLTASDELDAFVARYSPSGSIEWVVQISGDDDERAEAVAVDSADRIFVAGGFGHTLEVGSLRLDNPFANDYVFTLALSPAGDPLWLNGAGGNGRGTARSIDSALPGHVIIAGDFQVSIDFETQHFLSDGSDDLFVAAYDTDGVLRWARTGGGAGMTRTYGVAVNLSGEVFIGGDYDDPISFDGISVPEIYSVEDLFVAGMESIVGIDVENAVTQAAPCVPALYPNPAQNTLTILTCETSRRGTTVSIRDLIGRVEAIARDKGRSEAGLIRLDISLLPAGIHLVSIADEDGVSHATFTKVR
ncbi:MAG: T9SS type A sorting domain-containing protein [Rhodothermales bacterium]